MDSALLALALPSLSGMTMAVQGTLNSALGQVTGLWEATLIVQGVGLAVAGVLVFPLGTGSLAKAVQAPWYTWLGGALGVLIVYTVAKSIPKVGLPRQPPRLLWGRWGQPFC